MTDDFVIVWVFLYSFAVVCVSESAVWLSN